MAATLYARAYQTATTEAADPQQTLLLLLRGALRFLHQAREAMQRGDHEGQCDGIVRTQRIISALMTSLDRTLAPELAESLGSTYAWMHSRLTEASILDDQVLLEQVLECLTKLHEAWAQARRNLAEEELSESQAGAA